jgi:hypothetical protein
MLMPLDIHVVNTEEERPSQWPLCEFEEPVHDAIFFGGKIDLAHYPLLRRMQDYYADARYRGVDLSGLLAELTEVLPSFSGQPEVHQVLSEFQDICRRAAAQGRIVLCWCD